MDATDVEIVEKETPFQGYFRVDRYRLRHRLHNGEMGAEISREIFERGHAAAGLLYDPDLDLLVLLEQFRPGAYAALQSPWYSDDHSPWLSSNPSKNHPTPQVKKISSSYSDVATREALQCI